jgi:predicted ATPase/DNA-binding winged helix-turn-helix (wHTH) protein
LKLLLPPFTIDLDARTVRGSGRATTLTAAEARLLARLAQAAGELVSKERLLVEAWGYGPRVHSRTVDTTVSRLRAKIEVEPAAPRYLRTEPGRGLRLVVPSPEPPPVVATPAGPAGTFGRQRERAAITGALAGGRLVTLTGPGGAGKTHLARMVGGSFHALEACATEADLVRAVGRARWPGWEPQPADRVTLAERVRAEGPCLLVLDNLEQAVVPAAAVVRALLDAAPEARVLATSREPLGLAGEAIIPLLGLDPEAAAALFAARAPGVAGVEVAQVLAAVDHLPLAIELVAVWADVLPLATLAARLPARVDLLVSERRDVPERHRSLMAVVDGSIRLLDPDSLRALRQLAVFAGEFDVDGAEAVIGDPAALVRVRALQRRSLLHAVAARPGRFRLYEVVRAHVRAVDGIDAAAALRLARHLATGGGDELLLRLSELPDVSTSDLRASVLAALAGGEVETAARCARALSAVAGVDVADTIALLDRVAAAAPGELADRVGFDRARLWWAAGHLLEARAAVASLALPAEPHARVRTLQLAAAVERDSGATDAAVARLEAALAVADVAPEVRGSVLADLGAVRARRGETAAAAQALADGLALLGGARDSGARAAAMVNLAQIYRETGRDPMPLLGEALALHRAAGRRRSEGIVLGALGIARLDGGDPAGARASFREAVAVLSGVGARQVAAVFLANLAYVDRLSGRTAEAWEGYLRALATLREVGDTTYEALALGNLGELALEAGRVEEGLARLDEAVAKAAATRFSKLEGVFLGSVGLARVRAGQAAAGNAALARGETILRAGGYRDELCRLLARRALAAVVVGEPQAARRALAEARLLRRAVPWVDVLVGEAERAVEGGGDGEAGGPPSRRPTGAP